MSYRGTQQGGCLLEGTDPGQHFDADITSFFAFHLVDKRGHPVDAGIAGADNGYYFAFGRIIICFFGTCLLPFHP